MVQNIIDLDENEDRILNIVKAKYGLKNKSQAVAMLAKVYEDSFLEPELRPEYIKKLNIFSDAPTSLQELINPGKCCIINLKGINQELQEVIVYKLLKTDYETAAKDYKECKDIVRNKTLLKLS